MAASSTFSTLTLVENGIVLSFKDDTKRVVSYSDLDKIYIKVYKLKPVYELLFILFPFLLLFLAFQFMMLEKVMLVAFFSVIPVFVKTYKYKGCGLVICLKDETLYKKKLSLKTKSETVAIVNAVKKEQLNYYYKTNGLQKVPSQFCPKTAS
jgi:hypothetical protein